VWDTVDFMLRSSGTGSRTRAMRDAFENKKEELQNYLRAFTCSKGQHGLIVLIDGKVAGVEYLSSSKAFCEMFPKLTGSYAFEAMLREAHNRKNKKEGSGEQPEKPEGVELKEFEEMELFRELVQQARITRFKSPGQGWDHRIVAGRGTSITGNALVYRGEVIHLVTFGDSSMEPEKRRSSFRNGPEREEF